MIYLLFLTETRRSHSAGPIKGKWHWYQNRTKMEPESVTDGTKLAQGAGQGVPENQRRHEEVKKNAKANIQNEKTQMLLKVERFSQKSKGSTAVRLLWYYQQP